MGLVGSALGVMSLIWRGDEWLKLINDLSGNAIHDEAEAVLERSKTDIPYLTGAMEEGGYVEDDTFETAYVVFPADYARILHAHPDWDFHGRNPMWLDDAMAGADTGLADQMESGWPETEFES